MREYSFLIKPMGLRKRSHDTIGMSTLRNLQPEETHWRTPAVPTIRYATGQIIRGSAVTLLCQSTAVSSVNESTWALTPLESVTAGDYWHMADFGTAWLLFNGGTTIYSRLTELGFARTKITATHIGTGCAHYRTRLICGDVSAGQNWVQWSSFGGETIPYILGEVASPTVPIEGGRSPMPWSGQVLRTLPLADKVIIYGTNGVSAMRIVEASYGEDDLRDMPNDLGVVGRGAVFGNDYGHYFIGTDGNLWFIDPQLKVTQVGYDEFLPTANVAMSWDGSESCLWISGTGGTYVLSPYGLGGPIEGTVRSLARVNGALVGTGVFPALTEIEAWSHTIDMGESGQKKVAWIQLGCEGLSGLQVNAKYRFARSHSLSTWEWKAASTDGAGRVGVSMVDGQIGVKGTIVGQPRIDRIEVRYQTQDWRYRRGTKGVPEE